MWFLCVSIAVELLYNLCNLSLSVMHSHRYIYSVRSFPSSLIRLLFLFSIHCRRHTNKLSRDCVRLGWRYIPFKTGLYLFRAQCLLPPSCPYKFQMGRFLSCLFCLKTIPSTPYRYVCVKTNRVVFLFKKNWVRYLLSLRKLKYIYRIYMESDCRLMTYNFNNARNCNAATEIMFFYYKWRGYERTKTRFFVCTQL